MKAAKATPSPTTAPENKRGKSPAANDNTQANPLWQAMAMGDTIQQKCSACESENSPVQKQDADNDLIQEQADDNDGDMVQMWNCRGYTAPTCSLDVQSKEDDSDLMVQNKCSACESESSVQSQAEGRQQQSTKVQHYARYGIANASQSLPHLDEIQQSFGHHDVSSVKVQIGGPAQEAGLQMGALAYTSGERIAFREFPSLHLAAHESAHVIQQRSGLKLPGNVGTPGDRWERHADDVADKVVAGESAEELLDEVTPVADDGTSTESIEEGASSITIQNRITSGAYWQQEPPVAGDAAAAEESSSEQSGEEGAEKKDTAADSEQATEGGADAAAVEEAIDPRASCEKSDDENKDGDKQQTQQPPEEEQAPPDVTKGRCYDVAGEEPPSNAKDPDGKEAKNESKAEEKVTYPEWEEPNDVCDCEVGNELNNEAGGTGEDQTIASAQMSQVDGVSDAAPDTAADATQDQPDSGDVVAAADSGGDAAGGGESSAGGGETSDSSTMASMMTGEASRDTAVEDFYTAYGEVDGVPSRVHHLSQGLEFAGADRGTAAEEVQKTQALGQIRDFMMGAEAQISDAVTFVRDEVPARLASAAEFAKAEIDYSIAEQKAEISARIDAARTLAMSQASDTKGQIQSLYDTNVTSVNTQTDTALETLNSTYTTSSEAISQREDTVLTEINDRYKKGRENHELIGVGYAGQAIREGQSWVTEYEKCKSEKANWEDDGFFQGCLRVRQFKAQQDAACQTASATGKGMIELAKQTGFNLKEQRTQHRCAAVSGAGHAQKSLDMTIEQLSTGLEKGRKDTLASLLEIKNMNLTAVDGALTATLSKLDQQEYTQRQAVNDSGYIQQVAIEEMAHQTAAGLARSVSYAMDSLEITLGQLREQLTQGDVPDEATLAMTLATAEQGLGGGLGTLLEKMEEGAASAENKLLDAGFNGVDALAQITTANDSQTAETEQDFSGQMSTLVTATSTTMTAMVGKQSQKIQESLQFGTESMQKLVTGYDQTTEEIYKQVDKAILDSETKLHEDLTKKQEELPSKIATEAWKAAAKEQPAWKGALAIVLIILVIIASIVISVVTLGAGAPFLAVVLVGAVVGAVTAGLIQVINNWAAGEDLSKGVAQAMIMGAIGGALGGAIGAGANGIAQAAVQGAVRAGASRATQVALNIGINFAGDMVAEGLTQTVGYLGFGQQFNWQGFAMAGGMSVASTARGGLPGGPRPNAKARANVDAPTSGATSGARTVVKDNLIDLGIGMGLAGSVELLSYLQTGKYDMNRLFSSAASGAAGAKAASRGRMQGGSDGSSSKPRPQADTPDTPTSTPRPQGDAPSTPPKSQADTPDTPDTPKGRMGRMAEWAGSKRDALFSKMEISDDSRANQRVQKTMESVENWFGSGAGGRLDKFDGRVNGLVDGVNRLRGKTGDGDTAPTTKPQDTDAATSPVRQPDTDAPATRPQDADAPAVKPQGDADAPATTKPRDTADTDGQQRPKTGDSDADAPAPIKRPQADADVDPANKPVKDMTDAELTDLTTRKVTIGDEPHTSNLGKPSGNKVECEVCSACGPVRDKIAEIRKTLAQSGKADTPEGQSLTRALDKLLDDINIIESKIQGREYKRPGSDDNVGGKAGEYQAGPQVLKEAGDIAAALQKAGVEQKALGTLLDDPSLLALQKELFPVTGNSVVRNAAGEVTGLRPVDMAGLKPKPQNSTDDSSPTTTRNQAGEPDQTPQAKPRSQASEPDQTAPTTKSEPRDPTELMAKTDGGEIDTRVITDHTKFAADTSALLTGNQQAIYVFRGPDGMILKVGKTSGDASRIGAYKRAAELAEANGLKLSDFRLEVTPLKRGVSSKDAEFVEKALRAQMEAEGHIMPWDNSRLESVPKGQKHQGRLNRPGSGVPGEAVHGKYVFLKKPATPEVDDGKPKTRTPYREAADHKWRPEGMDVIPSHKGPEVWRNAPVYLKQYVDIDSRPKNVAEYRDYILELALQARARGGENFGLSHIVRSVHPTANRKQYDTLAKNIQAELVKDRLGLITDAQRTGKTKQDYKTALDNLRAKAKAESETRAQNSDSADTSTPPANKPPETTEPPAVKPPESTETVPPTNREAPETTGPPAAKPPETTEPATPKPIPVESLPENSRGMTTAMNKVSDLNAEPEVVAREMAADIPTGSKETYWGGRLYNTNEPSTALVGLSNKGTVVITIKDGHGSRYVIVDKISADGQTATVVDPWKQQVPVGDGGVQGTMPVADLLPLWGAGGNGVIFKGKKPS